MAIRNNRILKLEDGHVTFQYQASATDQTRSATVPAQEFIRRFLQHVLPDRFINVRYDGFLSPGNQHVLTTVSTLLGTNTAASPTTGQPLDVTAAINARDSPGAPSAETS